MNRTITITIVALFLTAGYSSAKAMAQEQKPFADYVQSLQQAEEILKPERKMLMVTHDPFEPIIVMPTRNEAIAAGAKLNNKPAAVAGKPPGDDLNDVRVVGIVRLDNDFRAFVFVGDKPRVVNVQDKIREFTIVNINMDLIVLNSGLKRIIKKRGKI